MLYWLTTPKVGASHWNTILVDLMLTALRLLRTTQFQNYANKVLYTLCMYMHI